MAPVAVAQKWEKRTSEQRRGWARAGDNTVPPGCVGLEVLAAVGQEQRAVDLPCVHLTAGVKDFHGEKKSRAGKTCWRPGLPGHLCRVWKGSD